MPFSPGDIVEIKTPAGLAYVQVTHNHTAYPEIVRVIEGCFNERPSDIRKLARRATAFTTMVPLSGALELHKIEGTKIGSENVPDKDKPFPTFKMPIRDKKGEVVYWWLWEGDGLRHTLVDDGSYDGYPVREVPTITNFLERIRSTVTKSSALA
jgi:hypothetical protein